MKIVIDKRYLVVPVSAYATTKKICFFLSIAGERKLVMDCDCKVDLISPDFIAYIDVSRFCGIELEYSSIPEMDFSLEQTDEKPMEDPRKDPFRPFVHYTPNSGWVNDPNGLIYYQGVYHLFYQHNPYGTAWGNMHWGHAVSRDLLHWEEQDIALSPDKMGTMYSGSAIEDIHNVAGLQCGATPTMLLFYTTAGDKCLLSNNKKYPQCLAYSNDNGKTFQKYAGNPVVEWTESRSRDPKVVWVDELSSYLMVIYIEGTRYSLLTSKNLLDWTHLQEVFIENEAECPDIMEFLVDEKKYWVISGASGKYIVGVFENGKFIQKSETKQLNYSFPPHIYYAAQSFSGMNDGRVVRIAWNSLHSPSKKAPNQMSVPTEMQLFYADGDFQLTSFPIKELENLYDRTQSLDDVRSRESICIPLTQAAYDISLEMEYRDNVYLDVFGQRITVNVNEHWIEMDRAKIPFDHKKNSVKMRMIIDRCSIEIFVDDGKHCAAASVVCDYNLPYLKISSAQDVYIKQLRCHRLKSVLEK